MTTREQLRDVFNRLAEDWRQMSGAVAGAPRAARVAISRWALRVLAEPGVGGQ